MDHVKKSSKSKKKKIRKSVRKERYGDRGSQNFKENISKTNGRGFELLK
ncbi:MAG: hypothetical protein ACK56F_27570 [bacterium]